MAVVKIVLDKVDDFLASIHRQKNCLFVCALQHQRLIFLWAHSMDEGEQSWNYAVTMSKTVLASVVKEIMSAVVPPDGSEERHDIRHILFHWECTHQDLVQSHAEPPGEIAAYAGVPVAVLPLVFGSDRTRARPAHGDPARAVFVQGLWMRKAFFEVLEVLGQSAPDACLDRIDFGSAGARFALECKKFCMAYVHFLCHPLVPEMLRIWEGEIHRLHEGYLRREDEEAVLAFLRAKAMFFGLRGTSYPWATLVERHSTSEAIRIAMESLQITNAAQ